MSILAVNVGSSSIKFALYSVREKNVGDAEMSGAIEGLEPSGHARIHWASKGEAKQSKTTRLLSMLTKTPLKLLSPD